MSEQEFEKLLDRYMFQVFLFTCPAFIPFNFARHSWFVINRKGVISRWEVNFLEQKGEKAWRHLNLDLLLPTKGIGILPYVTAVRWKSKLIGSIEGGEDSLADYMSAFIQNSPAAYPFSQTYRALGPNSNTYAQWILHKFPESRMHLPWNAVGKNAKES